MSKRFAKDDIDRLHDYGIHAPSRTIYIGSEGSEGGAENGVDYLCAERVIKNLHLLDAQSSEPITIILNSPGGEVFHGMAIYDAIKNCRSHVTIKATGYVMSMGSIILQAGDKRLLSQHAVMMLHHGYDTLNNHVKTIRNWVEFGKKYDKVVHGIYLEKIREKNTTFKEKQLDNLLDFDTILMSKEAVDLGLADEVYVPET